MDSLNKVCRACLGTNDVFTYIIHENVDQEIFLFCTSVRVSKYDCLPKTLCHFCYELIIKFSDFKKICIRSNDMLINSIYNIKSQRTKRKCEDVDNDEAPLPHTTNVKLESNSENDLTDYCDDANESTTAEDTKRFEELNLEIDKSCEKKAFHKSNDTNPKCQDVDDNAEAPLPQTTDVKFESNSENDLTDDVSHTATEDTIRFEELNFKLPKSRQKNAYNFSCEKCNRKFKYEEKYEAHKLWHDDGKPIVIKCDKCHKIFKKWQSLYRHKTSQHSVISLSNLQCPICGRICKSAQTLRGHQLLMHTREDTTLTDLSVCDICGKGFKYKINLKFHLKTHDTNRLRSHKCNLCDRSFFCRAAVTRHKTQCHDDRRYVCDYCSKMYRDKCSLVKHMTIHHQGKRFKCDICSKALVTSTSLRDHMRYHTGERPFECGECHKHFVTRKMLTEHRYIHTGEKPHKCDQCTQAFAQRGTLNRHMRVHRKPHRS